MINKINSKNKAIYLMVGLIILLSIQSYSLSHFIAVIISIIFLRKYLNLFNLLTLFLAIEFLLVPIPTRVDIVVISFLFVLIIYFIYPIIQSKGKVDRKSTVIMILALFLYLFFFSYSFFLQQIPLGDIFRGFIPFLLFFIFYPTVLLLKSKRLNFDKIVFSLVLWGLLYSLNNIILFILNTINSYAIYSRITMLDQNTISAMPLFLAVISLYFIVSGKCILFQRYTWIFIHAISVIGVFVTQTRSMILVVLLFYIMILAILVVTGKFKAFITYNVFIYSVGLMFTVLIFLSNSFRELLKNIFNRFERIGQGDHNVSERYDEYISALNIFSDNPLLGGGVGIRFNERYNELVNYMHNSFLYFLANIGIIGLLILLILLSYMASVIFKSRSTLIIGIYYGTLSLIIFSLFFSTYKWFFHNIIIGITFACILYLKQRTYNNVEK